MKQRQWLWGLAVWGILSGSLAWGQSTFTIGDPPVDFEVLDISPFDGIGDAGVFSTYNTVGLGSTGEDREMAEFDLSGFSVPPGEEIVGAVFEVRITSLQVSGMGVPAGDNPDIMAADGYVGDGVASISDYNAGDGNELDALDNSNPFVGQILTFDVTDFIKQLVAAGDSFAGITLRGEEFGLMAVFEGSGYPRLTIHTDVVADCGPDAKLKVKCKANGTKVKAVLKKATPNLNVTFQIDNGATLGATTNGNGKAVVTFTNQAPGGHTVTVCDLSGSC